MNEENRFISIAIDGPSGAGKSTIARVLSEELGYIYIDTGALYRAVGYYVVSKEISPSDSEAVSALLNEIDVAFRHIDGEQRVFVNESDVSDFIRSSEISAAASTVSAIPEVRSFLLDLQRDVAKSNNIVMDGRDIGTVILPDAEIKIFLTATPEDRAMRRYNQLRELGRATAEDTYENILAAVNERDFNDTNRKDAPLRRAEDAILIDTTGNTLEKTVGLMKETVLSRLKKL